MQIVFPNKGYLNPESAALGYLLALSFPHHFAGFIWDLRGVGDHGDVQD
ncbi:MAG: hypothetical protein OXC30_02945 [Alphaproteobacteria bacterium]|nr:hypothetical protein [Alphaproteobacteria bacterium]